MRNLKKFLALVLAMMMTLGLMVTANASISSDFSDAESITDEFTEAVAVLEGLEVFEGYEDGSFKPKNSITRAEVATIVYRLATGDVEGDKAHLYKDYQNFKDVASTDWYAGYVNYCANAEWIKGYGDGTFGPNKSVTGYQAAAMILRAVGYGKNGEFNGTGWQVQVANYTRSLGLLKNVDKTTYANTLNQAAPRELVAEILFQAGLIDTVTWTQMNGYRPGNPIQGATYLGNGLAWQNFDLDVSVWYVIDDWGRPGYYWFQDVGDGLPHTSGSNKNIVATIEADPDLEFNDVKKECDVAHELNISTTSDFILYVNYDNPITTDTMKYRIEATDTVTNVGGQGRVTEFYKSKAHPWSGLYGNSKFTLSQCVVMVDTYLATVTNVTERVLDPAGHVIVPAYLYLDVYDGHAVGNSDSSTNYNIANSTRNTSKHRVSDSTANWEYAKGDKVLVQGWTDWQQSETGANISGLNHWDPATPGTPDVTAINKAAFETNRLMPAGNFNTYPNDATTAAHNVASNISVLGKAEYKTGKQTVTYWNTGKHTVDGTEYMNANTLFLDVAKTTTNTTYAWYFDEYGNIIGIDSIPDTVNYGVITSIYSAFGQGESSTDGTAKAVANVLYADGSTATINIDKFLVAMDASTAQHPVPGTQLKANDQAQNAPYSWTTAGSAELIPVYDYNLSSATVMGATSRNVSSISAAMQAGNLHVAPVASINAGADSNGSGHFGIIRGNLYKFVASTDGNMTAIEVAGSTTAPFNNGVYAGHYNGAATVAGASPDKIYKNAGSFTLTSGGSTTVWLEEDAIIMIRASATSTSVNCYTLDTLPGDVTLTGTEVDWADTDSDNRADYVYVTGTVSGSLAYGLFYYNGGAAQWDGVSKTGTLFGWLNGEPTTLTFIGETTFNKVKNSQSYAGHLFAVELTNNVVTALLKDSSNNEMLLASGSLTTSANLNALSYVDALGNTINFKAGLVGNNPYNATPADGPLTDAVYYRDAAGGTPVSYNVSNRTITAGGNTYYLTSTSKVIGLGMGVNTDGAILEYLEKSNANDVTIIYTGSGANCSIVEIYVATDPNVTAPTPGDGSTLSLTYNQAARQFTVNFTNNTGKQLDTVVATVYYRMAGTNNPWVSAGSTSSETVNDTASNTNTTVTFGTIGSTTNFEAYVEIAGVYNGTTTNYTLNTLSNLTYFIA